VKGAQTAIGAGTLALGALIIVGATMISTEAGYGGVGPNFLPWLVAGVLVVCGLLIVREARSGGFRDMAEPSGAERPWWPGLVWVSAGLLANAALITRIGFILSCTLCYLLAVQGLRRAQGQSFGTAAIGIDALTGVLIAAPVFWTFTKFLAINLPGLTASGWI
jgi:putative tricarboxylic transport membrane protein